MQIQLCVLLLMHFKAEENSAKLAFGETLILMGEMNLTMFWHQV